MVRRVLRNTTVGIVANPASGRDIRRLVARASVFPVAEKCNIITRLLSALGAVGIQRVILMPDVGGISERLRRALVSHQHADSWPEVEFADINVEDGPHDTTRAVEQMVRAGVATIIVLGGDGTHRLVASACGEIPITALSTGTNNVFPEIREATVAGMAAGLVASGRICKAEATRRNKILEVAIDGVPRARALVDVVVSSEEWTGSKALWHSETLSQIFVTFAEPDAIGLSSVAGLVQPVSRSAGHGLCVQIAAPATARMTVEAPIAPGLIVPVGVAAVSKIYSGEPQYLRVPQGVIALDGEREIEFKSGQQVQVELSRNGPLTIDTRRVMVLAARKGLLRDGPYQKAKRA